MLALVYEQEGPVTVLETQQGCSPDIASRVGDKDAFAAKYGLRLVAGNFLLTRGGGRAVEELLVHPDCHPGDLACGLHI